jgi:signal transduction histidine kinase
MVAQLMDVSRIEEGRLSVEPAPMDLSVIVQETCGMYAPLAARGGNTIEIARGGASPLVLADRNRVAQVLVNLIANAARHTHDGTITVTLSEQGGFAQVEVRDTGEGIAPDLLKHLFVRYAQEQEAPLHGPRPGLGLGLTISRHIITRHGGTLAVDSQMGRGTAARFTLPLATRPAPPGPGDGDLPP